MQDAGRGPSLDHADSAGLVDELVESLRDTAREVVPWFVENMPVSYFQDTPREEQLTHLRAILAAKASDRPAEMTLRKEDGTQMAVMGPRNYPGALARTLSQLPDDGPIRAAKIHTAKDDNLFLVSFEFGEPEPWNPDDPEQRAAVQPMIDHLAKEAPEVPTEEVLAHIGRCSWDYLQTITPLRFARQWEYFRSVSGTDSATVALEDEEAADLSRIVVTVGNGITRRMLQRIATRLSRSRINIVRAHLDIIDDGDNGFVNLLGFVVQDPHGRAIDPQSELWDMVKKDLHRLKWIDPFTLDLAYRHEGLSLTRAEVVTALCHLAHQVLVKVNPHGFDRDRIITHAERNFTFTSEIVDLFLLRFNPERPMPDEEFEQVSRSIRDRVDAEVDLEAARTVLHNLLDCVAAVLRTNVFIRTRYALAFRIDPALLRTEERSELPYGVFFVHGRSFNAFHVRFRDIARGGVRAVRTIGADQHAREVERLYDEVYGLAFAQQLKNKDIPEGGAKAVILIEPDTPVDRSVKAFVDGLLDLITPDPTSQARIVDRFGQPELLYLGPDENITPRHIEWIVDRARRRGYPTPTALMSSKPGAGINHKVYGVTSEGVTVFLDVALRHLGIDPENQPFTVKMTGGPDGDVAGNEIKILNRDYGSNARIVGIADGSGVGEDPDGLDHGELLRLVEEALPIADFDRSKLGPRGRVVGVAEPEGVHLRNTLHSRVEADAFVPAGGRPATLHGNNWREYLREDGTPSSKLIVEGANLFLTPEARLRLSEHGCLIIKDSSANKCGVITSSFEIAACMLLDESEFLAIKEVFVEQVLVKLRALARREAELLLRVKSHHPDIPIFELSVRLSRVVIRTADVIEGAIDSLERKDKALMRNLVIEHLPQILVEKAGDRLWDQVPRTYLRWIMAKSLAARVVYREGFEYLESMPDETVETLAIEYLRREREREVLAREVLDAKLENGARIAELLDKAGILSTLSDNES